MFSNNLNTVLPNYETCNDIRTGNTIQRAKGHL